MNNNNNKQQQQPIRTNTINNNRNNNSNQIKLTSLITESADNNSNSNNTKMKVINKDRIKTVQKPTSTRPIFNQYHQPKRTVKSISPIKRNTLSPTKTNYSEPTSVFPLNCISLKTATQIKENLIQTLIKMKQRYRIGNNKRIIIEIQYL